MKLATVKLKDMVARAVKGSGNNKLIPITELIKIQVKDGVLTLCTTDGSNYLYIRETVSGEDFYTVVSTEVFSKLISRTTSEYVDLELTDSALKVIGNGSYRIELPLDENGEPVRYPDPLANKANMDSMDHSAIIKRSTVSDIVATLKTSLATTFEVPCYTGYYIDNDSVIATDTYKIGHMTTDGFSLGRVLLSPSVLDLLTIITDENINVRNNTNYYLFDSDNCSIYSPVMDGVDDYAVTAISDLIKTSFVSSCSVLKNDLLATLDRLTLFISPYDKNGIYLAFTADGLQITSKAASGIELIKYQKKGAVSEFTCMVDVEMLTQEVKAISSDTIIVEYGEPNAIKLSDGDKTTIIIALLEDD